MVSRLGFRREGYEVELRDSSVVACAGQQVLWFGLELAPLILDPDQRSFARVSEPGYR